MQPPGPKLRMILLAGACLLSGSLWAGATELAAVDYNRDIRPILANNCFACHGPDEGERQAGLRLDLLEAATQPAESGKRAIVPGQPDGSELLARIDAADEAERMPPVESNKKLTAEQKTLLRRWIADGARVETHWSLVPPLRPAIPAVKGTVNNPAWPDNPIDAFVLARLERESSNSGTLLEPAPPADRLTLARRVYLDLIGLLPTPEEADQFAADTRPDAYEHLVDRLLASPHYGERWARIWLDLARYSDTNGYEKDRPRSMWPYRDWVVRALNADMPFDRFTVEQIAGDLVPGADVDTRTATGFHRNTMVNEEGGIDVEEFRFQSMVDRVGTTGAVWLGLTVGCAQCHNHKFDPITQREYYQLFAMLNNADEPEMEVPQPDVTCARAAIERRIADLQEQARGQFDESKFAAWCETVGSSAQHWTFVTPSSAVSTGHATMTVLADQSVLASGDKPNQDTYVVELVADLPRVSAIRLEVLPHESLPQHGPGRAPLFSEGDFLLGEFSLAALTAGTEQPAAIALADASHSHAAEKTSAALAIDGDLDTGWSIKGRTGQPHQAVFRLAQPLDNSAGVQLRVTLQQRYIHQMTIGRFRLAVSGDSGLKAVDLPAEVEAILALVPSDRTAEQLAALKAYYLSIAPELAELNQQIVKLRSELPSQPTTLVMCEREPKHARVTRLAHRGEFLSPRDPITGAVPSVLHPLPAGPANRLALARWLVDRRNPLVARVTMNRHWQQFFGRGLVRTTEDFGVRGEAPSHPALLDFLACEFMDRGWSFKQMHRLIATSATYRQSSAVTPLARGHDPDNILLARGPRLRVDAEMVRDLALGASGLLCERLGGASVYPPQPAGVTELAYGGGGGWPTSQGADRFRRGLYTYSKRTSPYAAFSTFDAPSGETCMVRRERSNTPLQALTLLNDGAFVETSQALARRAMLDGGDTNQRARLLFRLCLTREPTDDELHELTAFFESQRSRLATDSASAAAIAGGEPAVDLAAWTLVARAITNLDEFISKQ